MKLFLLRSSDSKTSKHDSLREISAKGQKSLKKLPNFLDKKEFRCVSEIRHSPYISAKKTAEKLRKLMGLKTRLREVPLLEPTADFRILADILSNSNKDLILVGHQPNLGLLASYLVTQECKWKFVAPKKSPLTCLEKRNGKEIQKGWGTNWQLKWFLTNNMTRKKPYKCIRYAENKLD